MSTNKKSQRGLNSSQKNSKVKLNKCFEQTISTLPNDKRVYYDSDTKNIPPWYNRGGPGQYDNIELDKLSMRTTGTSVKINPNSVPINYQIALKKMT